MSDLQVMLYFMGGIGRVKGDLLELLQIYFKEFRLFLMIVAVSMGD